MKNDDSFFDRVYEVTRMIPEGRVTSYGAIARFLGLGKSARMVGWALNGSHHLPEYIPAHRVVNRNGLLTGKHHFRHEKLMQELLESEGVKVKNDQVLNFNNVFWDPNQELF
ncbi:MAG: methylated-DNA--[protein]-cysteine S-methyltransferase [Bacteroidetes bacterium]|jgi:methylated-DNA-protein-cysteine methyltransferase-like protein|nr:methylated-DNA--[protein]-cysteine S-methyltransferase [Bacteroidota bacterium]